MQLQALVGYAISARKHNCTLVLPTSPLGMGCLLAAVAFGAATAHALTVIAIAWIAHRPLLSAASLTVVVIVVCGGVGAVTRGRKVARD